MPLYSVPYERYPSHSRIITFILYPQQLRGSCLNCLGQKSAYLLSSRKFWPAPLVTTWINRLRYYAEWMNVVHRYTIVNM